MKIHKEGHSIIINQFILLILIGIISTFNDKFLEYTLPIFSLIILFTIYFFRIPKREFSIKDGKIYSPCDGKVVVIEETIENEYFKDSRIQISIFMSPLNIHNNLYPINGKIEYTKYHPGKFLVAWNPKSSLENERNSIVVNNNKIKILCRQIAGALAKRIVNYAKIGDNVTQSKDSGFIKFGSRVDIFLPLGTKIKVKLHQKVVGGITVVAQK